MADLEVEPQISGHLAEQIVESDRIQSRRHRDSDDMVTTLILGAVTAASVSLGALLMETRYWDQDVARIRLMLDSLGIGE